MPALVDNKPQWSMSSTGLNTEVGKMKKQLAGKHCKGGGLQKTCEPLRPKVTIGGVLGYVLASQMKALSALLSLNHH